MSKKKAITLAVCSLIVGLVCGGWLYGFGFVSYLKFTSQGQKAAAFVGASQDLRVLKNLRNGDTNSAIESLEVQLDSHLVELWAWNKDTPPGKRDPHVLKLLSNIRDYRSNYPRRNWPTVPEILSWTDGVHGQ
jgi:hypothetical protein